MPKIFISYRRMDSQERAHRIADWLVLKFGIDNVFIDVDHLGGGVDFAADISKGLDATDVLLVIIGDKWTDELRRRMEASVELDLVRFEVSKGLESVPLVIPVLLSEDVQLDPNRLPDDIRPLVKRNYRYVRLKDFHQDMERLYTEIDEQFRHEKQATKTSQSKIWLFSGLGIFFIIVSALLYFTVGQDYLKQLSYTKTPENPQTEAALQATLEAQPTATITPNSRATFDAASTEIRQTATTNAQQTIAAYTDTPTSTPTATDTHSPTPQLTETAVAAQAATDELGTQIAQSTANAPTNTPRPSHTPTPTSTMTASPTPTATANRTATQQTNLDATQTEYAFSTQVIETVQAGVVAQNAVIRTQAAATSTQVALNDQATVTTRAQENRLATASQNILNGQATSTAIAQENRLATASQNILNDQATSTARAQNNQSESSTQIVANNQATATARAQENRVATASQNILNDQATSTARAQNNQSESSTQIVTNNQSTATQRAFSADVLGTQIITIPGSYQSEIGCTFDWMPDCVLTQLNDDDGNSMYTWTTNDIPIGDWEVKVTIGGTWDDNYGLGGIPSGENVPFRVSRNNQEITFSFDIRTHVLIVRAE